jgi:hypothetical protein
MAASGINTKVALDPEYPKVIQSSGSVNLKKPLKETQGH